MAVLSSFSQLVQEPGHTEAAGPQGRAARGTREGETENKGGQKRRQRPVDSPIYLGMRICYKCVISMQIHVAVGGCCLVAKLCPTLCDPMDCSPPGFSVHGFSRQEHWNGCHFLLRGIFPIQGLNLFKNLFILFLMFLNLFFYWRIIALQNFVVFCQTSTWISLRYTHVPSLLDLPPISLPTPLRFLSHTAIPVGCLFYIWWCKFPCYSFHTSRPLLPPHVHKSILYVCFSIAAL